MNDTTPTHEATGDCSGTPFRKCVECGKGLCACESAYGHDCEAPETAVNVNRGAW